MGLFDTTRFRSPLEYLFTPTIIKHKQRSSSSSFIHEAGDFSVSSSATLEDSKELVIEERLANLETRRHVVSLQQSTALLLKRVAVQEIAIADLSAMISGTKGDSQGDSQGDPQKGVSTTTENMQ